MAGATPGSGSSCAARRATPPTPRSPPRSPRSRAESDTPSPPVRRSRLPPPRPRRRRRARRDWRRDRDSLREAATALADAGVWEEVAALRRPLVALGQRLDGDRADPGAGRRRRRPAATSPAAALKANLAAVAEGFSASSGCAASAVRSDAIDSRRSPAPIASTSDGRADAALPRRRHRHHAAAGPRSVTSSCSASAPAARCRRASSVRMRRRSPRRRHVGAGDVGQRQEDSTSSAISPSPARISRACGAFGQGVEGERQDLQHQRLVARIDAAGPAPGPPRRVDSTDCTRSKGRPAPGRRQVLPAEPVHQQRSSSRRRAHAIRRFGPPRPPSSASRRAGATAAQRHPRKGALSLMRPLVDALDPRPAGGKLFLDPLVAAVEVIGTRATRVSPSAASPARIRLTLARRSIAVTGAPRSSHPGSAVAVLAVHLDPVRPSATAPARA